jgi:hypothetical protein
MATTRYMVILLLLLTGCSQTFQPVCRHNAVLAAITVGEQYPTKIAFGPIKGKAGELIWHSQAKAYINGEWVWLNKIGNSIQVGTIEKFDPLNEYTIKEFLDKFFRFYKGENK